MQQYNLPTVKNTSTTVDKRAEPMTEVLVLQRQVGQLHNTIALQSRQIRRLESAVQVLENLVNSRIR